MLGLEIFKFTLISTLSLFAYLICIICALLFIRLTLFPNFLLNQSKLFISHGDEILKGFSVFGLLLLEDYAQTVEVFIKYGFRQFFFELGHFDFKSHETFFDFFRIIMKSCVVEGCVIEK